MTVVVKLGSLVSTLLFLTTVSALAECPNPLPQPLPADKYYECLAELSSLRDANKNLQAIVADKLVQQKRLDRAIAELYASHDQPYCDEATKRVPRHLNGLYNLALLRNTKVEASSAWRQSPAPLRHAISHLNDGWYGDCRSWIADAMPAWIVLKFDAVFPISMVAFGSDNNIPGWRDRAAKSFRISTSTVVENPDWKQIDDVVKTVERGVVLRQEFSFAERMACCVRIDIFSTLSGDNVRIDEVEVYGKFP